MTRFKYAVAAYMVLSTLHRFRNEAFLVRSFRPEDGGGSATPSTNNEGSNNTARNNTRLSYIRPRGDLHSLLSIFEILTNSSAPSKNMPRTPQQMARKYGIPRTLRNVTCKPNGTTTVGWIPNAIYPPDYLEPDSLNVNTSPHTHQGRIPKIIYQSWKSNKLSYANCVNVLRWSSMNPGYDYLLFDDDAIDDFIRMEYGREVFGSYVCVKVGAAKCDVWRLLVVYLFGGVYFDVDVKLLTPLGDWDWGNRDVVTARSCRIRKHPGGCAHQWGLIYAPKHPVLRSAITETLTNLAERKSKDVYGIAFWAYYNAWRNGPYNQSYMPGWSDSMGGRVLFMDDDAKKDMVKENGHWPTNKKIWEDECMV